MINYRNWLHWLKSSSKKSEGAPKTLGRKHHNISRKNISPNALKVLYRLGKNGFSAYLVGGSVRDLLLGQAPKDFDVVTDALPEQITKIFRNSRLIGRRFRLVHIYFRGEVIEASTFRANVSDEKDGESAPVSMLANNNIYGTIEEDAWRRDFTINSLYYNIENFAVLDYTNGLDDIDKKVIRMIGDPWQRYHEDPVRLLRAIRLSAKLQFTIAPETKRPIYELGHLLVHVPPARLLEEILKLFFKGYAFVTYQALEHYGYHKILFPKTYQAMPVRKLESDQKLITLALQEADRRYGEGLPLNPGFLLAIILWPALQFEIETMQKTDHKFFLLHEAINKVVANQRENVMITRRLALMMRSIWLLQYQLIKRRVKRLEQLLHHRYFRAAYDFLELRNRSGEELDDVVQWWEKYRRARGKQKRVLVDSLQ